MSRRWAPGITTAQRLTVTLEEREFVYDTDLDRFYVGDGSTVGGLRVANYAELTAADSAMDTRVDVLEAKIPTRSVKEIAFGAVGDGVTDDTAAITAAHAWLAAQTTPSRLVFPGGIYKYSVSPNWAIEGAIIDAEGEVRLRYTGTGNAVILDGGNDDPVGVHCCTFGSVGRFIVECPRGGQNAIFTRAFHEGSVRATVVGAGYSAGVPAYAALRVNGCTGSVFDVTASVNFEGWYDDGSGAAKPKYGYFVTQNASQGPSSYCTFFVSAAGTEIGTYREYTLGCNFYGVGCQGCTDLGDYGASTSFADKLAYLDFEANTNGDISCNGEATIYDNCHTNSSVSFGSTAIGCVLDGGLHKSITMAAGSKACRVTSHTTYNRENLGGTLTNSGHQNLIERGVRNGTSNILETYQRRLVVLEDDFLGDALGDPWAATLGSDGDCAVRIPSSSVLGGVVELTTGNDAGASMALNGAQLDQGRLQWNAAQGNLEMEFSITLDAITTVACFIGFTDQVAALEMPVHSAASADTITTNASDAVGIMFDTSMATDNWWLVGVKANTDATHQNTSVAPVAGTYERWRIVVTSAGVAYFYRNDALVGSAMSNAITGATQLTPVIAVFARGAVFRSLLCDYIRVQMNR